MNEKKMTFEESMERLQQIVRAMERGDVALEESLDLFREGTALVKECSRMLDEAQLQISKVTVGTDSQPVLEGFDDGQ